MDKIEIIVSVIVFLMILSVVSIIPPIISKGRYRITWWDYVFPFLTVAIWFLLLAFKVGNEISRTNFMFEIFLIMLLSTMVPWMRYYLAFSKLKVVAYLSFVLTFLPVIVTICLRMFMPLLPE